MGQRALRLCAPQAVRRDEDCTHRVGLDAILSVLDQGSGFVLRHVFSPVWPFISMSVLCIMPIVTALEQEVIDGSTCVGFLLDRSGQSVVKRTSAFELRIR